MKKQLKLLIMGIALLFNWVKSPAQEPLKEGSKVPEFTLPNQDGKEFNIADVIGKYNLVIYFYPKDDTPGCTKEACYFRDQYETFTNAGAKVIGISSQGVNSHKQFAEKYKLPFTLLCDEENKVRKLFGVSSSLNGLIPGRVTYVVDKKGVVVFIFNSQTEATKHVDEALRVIKSLK